MTSIQLIGLVLLVLSAMCTAGWSPLSLFLIKQTMMCQNFLSFQMILVQSFQIISVQSFQVSNEKQSNELF